MKIELSLAALERLIAGDTELELSLRRQIVEEFSKRHLKSVAESTSYVAAVNATKEFVNAAAKEAFDIENLATSHLWPTIGYRLRSMIESLVMESAERIVNEQLLKSIEHQRMYWADEVRKSVKSSIAENIEQLVREGIQQRLAAAASATVPATPNT